LNRIVHAINLLPSVSTDAQYSAAVWEVISDPVFMNSRSPGVILTGMGLAGLIAGLLEFIQQDHITTLRGQPLPQGQFLSGAVGLFALAQVLHMSRPVQVAFCENVNVNATSLARYLRNTDGNGLLHGAERSHLGRAVCIGFLLKLLRLLGDHVP
jgi:hypothetical protein